MSFLRYTGLFLSILISLSASAQRNTRSFTLSGTVTSQAGTPLPGASVFISDLRKGAVADSSGHYAIKNIPEGTFLVNCDMVGYRSELQNITFGSDVQYNFELEMAVTEEKEIVILSALQATSLKKNPIPIVSISKNFLTQNMNTNVVSAIANVPGVSAVTTGPNVAKPFIRGLGFNRILTLFDGVRQEGQQWGDEHGVEIDENLVEHVEVIKGPASLLYGSDAIGGVVNFIPPMAPPQGKNQGSAAILYQTNNNMLEGTANLEGHPGDLSWNLIGSHKMAADYQNKIDGRVYNTGFRESSIFFKTAINKQWGHSRLGISYYNNLQEIPDGRRDSASRRFEKEIDEDTYVIVPDRELRSYKISDVHQRIQHFRVYDISSFIINRGRIGTQLGFQKNIRREYEDPNSNDPALFLNLNTLTYDIKYFLPKIAKIDFTTGVNGMYQVNISDEGHEFLIPDYKQFDAGAFVYGKLSHNRSEWAGGIRFDMRHYHNEPLYVVEDGDEQVPVTGPDTATAERIFAPYTHTFGGLSGSIGFSHRFNRAWHLKINVARGYRAPNISEISSNGIHAGSKIYQLGNTHFKPEFSFQQDLEVGFNSEHVTITASVFNNQIQNYIFNQKLLATDGTDSIIVPGYETFQYNASRAHLYGGEFSIDLHPHPLDWLHFENTLSMVFAKNTGRKGQHISTDEMYLPFVPPVHGRSELRANFHSWKSLKNVYAKFQMDVYARQDRVFSMNGTETPTAGYQLFNAGFGAQFTNKKGREVLGLNLMVHNLFDVAYQSHLSRLKYFEDYPADPRGHHGIYGMGRNISLRLTAPFSF